MTTQSVRKLMLIDGHALVHRAFHALPPDMSTTSGELTNAVFGWASMVIKAIDDLKPTHAIAAFDTPKPTFRHEQYAGYKATRARTPPPLIKQFDRVRQVAEAFHMPIVEMPGFEADDVLGTLAGQAEAQGVPTVIVTGDLDTLQLVDEYVTVLTSKRQLSETILYDIERVFVRFGIAPKQIPDLKGLIGDTSDNIPGIRGVGEKTAAKLLADFGSLEGIFENLDSIKGKVADLLRENREQSFASRELARIVSVPVDLDLDAAAFTDLDMPALIALFRELEFRSLIPRVQALRPGGAVLAKKRESPGTAQMSLFGSEDGSADAIEEPAILVSPTTVEVVDTPDRLTSLVRELSGQSAFALVAEAEGGHMVDADLIGLAFSTREAAAWYVPLGHAEGEQLDPVVALQALAVPLEDPAIRKVGHDLKQTVLVLGSHGVTLRGLSVDTMLASYLENASGRLLAVDALSAQHLGVEIGTHDLLTGTGRKRVPLRDIPVAAMASYLGTLADVILRLAEPMRERLFHRKLIDLLDKVEMPLIEVLAQMERNGVSLDCDLLMSMSMDLSATLAGIEQRIYERVGHSFNINSPPQLGEVLFNEMNLKKSRRTKTGYSTDNEVLERLRDENPVVDDILEFRQLIKLKSTYIDALPALLSRRDGKLHTEFNQAVAATGRLSSSNPNLQNIPIRTELGHRIRRAFIPSEADSVLLAADYSQIELRVLAHLSGDPRLTEAFLNDQDIHVVTAAAVWGIDQAEVSSDQRRIAKVVNFGIAYGIGEQRLAYETGLSREEAAAFIASYRATYQGVTDFMDKVREHAQLYGQVSTLLGRVRGLPEIHSSHPGLRQGAERAAINMPVQGTAADIIKMAMIDIARAMTDQSLRSTMILQVHDELVFEVPRGELDAMAQLVHDGMAQAIKLDVPLAVDVNVGENWGELSRIHLPDRLPQPSENAGSIPR
ncbi:MAG TPA: DNA polymerase I [Chloroflexota bacterium]|jgi:DNA polymerase-1|nr:DNA polymerase I [Chloroflexota bacterium]